MELVICGSRNSTSIDTEERRVTASLDKGDKLVVALGINRVEIEYVGDSWTITHGANIVNKLLPQTDPNAFCHVGAKLV